MTKKIAIRPADIDALEALAERVNGNALTHTMTGREIASHIPAIEALRIETKLSKALSVGMEAEAVTAGASSNAYRNVVIGSRAYYRYFADGWRVVGFERAGRYPKAKAEVKLTTISAEQAEEIKARSVAGLTIRKAA